MRLRFMHYDLGMRFAGALVLKDRCVVLFTMPAFWNFHKRRKWLG